MRNKYIGENHHVSENKHVGKNHHVGENKHIDKNHYVGENKHIGKNKYAGGNTHVEGNTYVEAGLAPALLAICLLAILTVMIAACGTHTGNNPNTVYMNDTIFEQSSITIKKGQNLTLTNDVSVVHIIENGTWDNNGTPRPNKEAGAPTVNSIINGGGSQTFGPFNTAGTFQLYCTVHPGMNLTVIVK